MAVRVANVVDCMGLSTDVTTSRNPLIRQILATGLVRPDPLGLGLETTRDWRVIDASGRVAQNLFAIGPLTRGVAWETIAIPDIRIQCAEIARLVTLTPMRARSA